MCLTIWTFMHSDLEPLVAEEDIEVVKYLKKPIKVQIPVVDYATGKLIITREEEQALCTPFREVPVEFDENGECVMTVPELKRQYACDEWIVEEGIHAYIRADAFLFECVPFHAYIPKGTKYYLGTNGDIVAEKMVIKNI